MVGAGAGNKDLRASAFFGAANEKGFAAAGAGVGSTGLGVAKLNPGTPGADDFTADAAGREIFGTVDSVAGAVTVTVGAEIAVGVGTGKGVGVGAA